MDQLEYMALMHGILILWYMLINIADLSDLPPAISVTAQSVFRALKAFPKGSYPGGFQLQTQHLLDAVSGFTAPVAQDCLHQITCLVNFLLLGKALPSCSSLAVWSSNHCFTQEEWRSAS